MPEAKQQIGIGVVFACHDGRGNFLFARRGRGARDGHGMWEIPAGELDYGEALESGLIRELREELGAAPRRIEFMGHKEIFKKEEHEEVIYHWIAFEYLVELDPQEVRICEPDKCEAIEWRSLEDIPTPLRESSSDTIHNIRKHLSIA